MKQLFVSLFCMFSIATFAQDAEVEENKDPSQMTKEEKIAAARAKAKAENTDTVQAPSMTTYEEAAKSYDLAQGLEEQRKYDEAQAEYDKAIEIDPNFVEAYVKRGGLKFQKIEFAAAMEDYNRAVEISENLVEMHEYKASILDLGYGRAKTDWPDLCQ